MAGSGLICSVGRRRVAAAWDMAEQSMSLICLVKMKMEYLQHTQAYFAPYNALYSFGFMLCDT